MSSLDPKVNRLKYEHEVSVLTSRRKDLQSLGIFVLEERATFPIVELLYVPRHPLQIGIPQQSAGLIALPPGIPIGSLPMATAEVPSLSARAFKAHFDLTDFDLRAPSLEFRDPWTDDVLPYSTMFRAFEYEKHRQAHLVLLDDHPTTHKPFLCLRGVREYHEHPQHSGDDWLLYRTHMNLFSVIMSLWRATIDLAHPMLIPQGSNIQVHWNVEGKD